MILVKRGAAIFLYVLFSASIVAIGIYAYLALGNTPDMYTELKAKSETILFIALAGAAIILVTFIVVAWRTTSLYRELDKIIELNKRGDFSPELSMNRLGPIGKRITLLYFTLNSLNEKKTRKISGLSGLVEFLIDNVDISLLATDVQGYIRYASRKLADQIDWPRSKLISRNVDEVFPGVPYRDSVLELDRRSSSVELQGQKTPVTLVGIRDRSNELSYVVWLFGGSAYLPEGSSDKERMKIRSERLRRVFNGVRAKINRAG